VIRENIPADGNARTIAYLTSAYPAISHTFILREVLALRASGLTIRTYTVRRSLPHALLSDVDRAENAQTEAILPVGFRRLIGAHASAIVRLRRRYLSTLAYALRRSLGGSRAILWQAFYFTEAVVMWESCRRHGIAHIHVHFANNAADIALLAARLGAPGPRAWSFTMHGTGLSDVTLINLTEKVREASLVVCISDFTRSQLMILVDDREWSKLVVVRSGVDIRRFVSRAEPQIATDRLRILFVGRLSAEKAPQLLLDAVFDLRAAGVPCDVTFVGAGPLFERLQARVTEASLGSTVRLLGPLGHGDVAELYGRADVFVLPSLTEGVPVVLMEAMASGLPVVTTRIKGIPELVSDPDHGRLVAPGSIKQLTDALREISAMSPAERHELGQAGRRRVADSYDLGRNVVDLLRAFEAAGVLATRGGTEVSR